MKKILIIRFSSIGDIVLTTPVVRCIKRQLKDAEVHFVTKAAFAEVLGNNPYIDRIHTFKKDVAELYSALRREKFDHVIDLHKNLRSFRLKQALGAKSTSFNKLNLEKFLAVKLKALSRLPSIHIVERYLATVAPLGVKSDGEGLDYFISENDKVDTGNVLFKGKPAKYTVLVVGGSYYTKQIPISKLREICSASALPIVLMGGKGDSIIAKELCKEFPALVNTCGAFSIGQSASVIQQAEWVITSDTGLMHIASAFDKKIISLWGNTIPEFGMSPYKPNGDCRILEVKGLSCRPCSKLGYKKCPKGHFKCMNEIDVSVVKTLG